MEYDYEVLIFVFPDNDVTDVIMVSFLIIAYLLVNEFLCGLNLGLQDCDVYNMFRTVRLVNLRKKEKIKVETLTSESYTIFFYARVSIAQMNVILFDWCIWIF